MVFYIIYSVTQRHVSMPRVLRQLHEVLLSCMVYNGTRTNSPSDSSYICHRNWNFNFISMATKYQPANKQCPTRNN